MVKQIGKLHAAVADIAAKREIRRYLYADWRVGPAKKVQILIKKELAKSLCIVYTVYWTNSPITVHLVRHMNLGE